MRVNGIIAEYSPFHNGHRYQLERASSLTGADYTIVVMSGNFTQRGLPALPDKYTRARMALMGGADLVLELPCMYAVSSAEYFAYGGVTLLDRLHVTDFLSFGSETGDIEALNGVAGVLASEPEAFSTSLKEFLKKGLSFPSARAAALQEMLPDLPADILSSPNNILGVEYLKVLHRRNSSIHPITIKRIGADYHDSDINQEYSSASAIRECILSDAGLRKAAGDAPPLPEVLNKAMPGSALSLLNDALKERRPLSVDDFSGLLLYRLLSEVEDGYTKYLDVSPALSDRIKANLYSFRTFSEFCTLLKTRDLTYSRVNRALLHILLGITAEDFNRFHAADVPYARVLGFRESAGELLSAIKKNSEIPLITKLADAQHILPPDAYEMFCRNLTYESIYESVSASLSGKPMRHEFTIPIVKV